MNKKVIITLVIIVLALTSVLSVSYIVYDKVLTKEDEKVENKPEKDKKENILTENEATELVNDLYRNAVKVLNNGIIIYCDDNEDVFNTSKTTTINNMSYILSDFNNLNELKNHLNNYFTTDFIDTYMLNDKKICNGGQRYIEKDGKLYCIREACSDNENSHNLGKYKLEKVNIEANKIEYKITQEVFDLSKTVEIDEFFECVKSTNDKYSFDDLSECPTKEVSQVIYIVKENDKWIIKDLNSTLYDYLKTDFH